VISQSLNARAIYGSPEAPQKTPRAIEYDLLARVTQQLATAWATRRQNYPALMTALDDNLRLWTTLAADVAEPSNGLPAPLRAQLFYLYEFAAQHSRAVREKDASVEVLIDINTAVMRGLRGDGGTT
jgi:flagellar protein FlaF